MTFDLLHKFCFRGPDTDFCLGKGVHCLNNCFYRCHSPMSTEVKLLYLQKYFIGALY